MLYSQVSARFAAAFKLSCMHVLGLAPRRQPTLFVHHSLRLGTSQAALFAHHSLRLSPHPAPLPQEVVEEEVVVVAQKKPSLFGFFQKAEQVAVEEEEVEEEEEEEVRQTGLLTPERGRKTNTAGRAAESCWSAAAARALGVASAVHIGRRGSRIGAAQSAQHQACCLPTLYPPPQEEAAAAPPARQQQQRPAFAFFGGKKAEEPAAEEEDGTAAKAAAAAAAASAAAAKQAAEQAAAKKAAEQAAARQRAEQEAAAAKAAAEAEAAKAAPSAEEQEAARKKAEQEVRPGAGFGRQLLCNALPVAAWLCVSTLHWSCCAAWPLCRLRQLLETAPALGHGPHNQQLSLRTCVACNAAGGWAGCPPHSSCSVPAC